jgi:hypothetical protein
MRLSRRRDYFSVQKTFVDECVAEYAFFGIKATTDPLAALIGHSIQPTRMLAASRFHIPYSMLRDVLNTIVFITRDNL